jgi:hypothetical protein
VESISCRVEAEAGHRFLDARVEIIGDDLVVAVGGGERPHVGCVVLAQPYPSKEDPGAWSSSISVLCIPPHKEEPIARGIAKTLCAALGRVAVVTAGVHDDSIDAAGISTYLRLGEELAQALLTRVRQAVGERSAPGKRLE